MNKIYLVEANFDDWESSWSIKIGVFSDKKIAEKHKTKWEKFYKDNKSIFDEPKDWELSENDYMYEIDTWEESEALSILKMRYEEISQFNEITIHELDFNQDTFIESDKFRPEPLKDLLKQWDRDYKLNELL